jgi:hypothetical protein
MNKTAQYEWLVCDVVDCKVESPIRPSPVYDEDPLELPIGWTEVNFAGDVRGPAGPQGPKHFCPEHRPRVDIGSKEIIGEK